MLNKIQKGKRNLILLGVFLAVLTVLCIIGAVLCTVFAQTRWWMYVIAAVLYAVGILGLVVSITFIWTACAMKATVGNLMEGNIPLENGTINATRCKNCGATIKAQDEFCPECGKPTTGKKVCENCGTENDVSSSICTKCGQKL